MRNAPLWPHAPLPSALQLWALLLWAHLLRLLPRRPCTPVLPTTSRLRWQLGLMAQPTARRTLMRLALVLAACALLLMLSACGTAPLRVSTCPALDALLLTPPHQPVPLMPE